MTLLAIVHIIDIFLASHRARCPGAGVILLVGRMVRPGCPGWSWPAGEWAGIDWAGIRAMLWWVGLWLSGSWADACPLVGETRILG